MSAAQQLRPSAITVAPVAQLRSTVRRARWLLVVLHLPLMLFPVVITSAASEDPSGSPLVVAPLALAIGALQLRHSLAAARGERPRHWPWTLLALLALVYVPMLWLTWRWYTTLWFVIASAAMLLPRRSAAVVIAVQVPVALLLHHLPWAGEGLSAARWSWLVVYLAVILSLGGAGLYGAARLVRTVDELYDARAELAQVAVGRERLRISRDLHDLLGASLSAVSLKGDLALQLLSSDPPAARSEIESLTGVARDALRDVRAITRDERDASFRDEIEGAAALLAAAGIDSSINADLPNPSPAAATVLAWAVREGVTNVLRHSEAGTCSITARQQNGSVRLEIVNDGADTPVGEGNGLTGLAERARAVSGSARAERTDDGRFRLLVEVPAEIP
jgi:two-component system, NarL family, sensor histidine kinase DesK